MTAPDILAPVVALKLPDSVALAGRAQAALTFIEGFTIDSQEAYSLAGEELLAIKRRSNMLEEQRTAITGPMNTALRAVNDLFRGPSDLLGRAEVALKSKMLTYQQEQERIAAEARRKAEEAAAAERARLAAEAAERQRAADEQARAAEAARAAGDAQAAELATAAAHRAQAEAQVAADTALMVTAAVPATIAPKARGVSTSRRLDFEVIDLAALVQFIATGEVPTPEKAAKLARPDLLGLLSPDSVKLRAYVRGLGTACALPGVRVTEERSMVARAA